MPGSAWSACTSSNRYQVRRSRVLGRRMRLLTARSIHSVNRPRVISRSLYEPVMNMIEPSRLSVAIQSRIEKAGGPPGTGSGMKRSACPLTFRTDRIDSAMRAAFSVVSGAAIVSSSLALIDFRSACIR